MVSEARARSFCAPRDAIICGEETICLEEYGRVRKKAETLHLTEKREGVKEIVATI